MMEQQQFKVRLSVGTKLLLGVVALLATAVASLNVSSVLLLEDDKRAYTLQAQSTESVLVGRELEHLTQASLDTARSMLAQADPRKPVTTPALVAFLENQKSLAAATLVALPKNGAPPTLESVSLVTSPFTAERIVIKPEELEIPEALRVSYFKGLATGGLAIANASRVGGPPLMALAFADLTQTLNPDAIPAIIAWIPLDQIGKDIAGSRISAVSREGLVLFDTDTPNIYGLENLVDDPLFEAATRSMTLNGATEFHADDGERFLGSYFKPGFGITVLARTPWKLAMAATYAVREKFILIGLMAIGGAVLFALFFAKSISSPIQSLYEATKEVASGNFNLRLSSSSRDEIGALTGSFEVMSRKIVELIDEKMKQVQLEQEVQIASTIQQTLIPPPQVTDDFVRIESYYKSAAQCGGDWWSYFEVGDKVCVMIADATGHGMPSALITAAARSCFSVLNKLAQDDPDFSYSPVEMLSFANRVIHEAAHGKIMMTFFVATLDFRAGKLTYSSAGHNPPWLFKKSGDKYVLKSLTAVGQRLGEEADNSAYEEHTLDIAEGDILFLYTDGLTEGKNLDGEMYGKKRVKRVMEAEVSQGPYQSLQTLTREFMNHNGEKPLDDDVTLAVIEMYPNGKAQALAKLRTMAPGSHEPAQSFAAASPTAPPAASDGAGLLSQITLQPPLLIPGEGGGT
jgi:sigma-B regulation protein RsbU (phosphoserine phosphatase)